MESGSPELGEPAPVPERVEQVGWEWEPELGSSALRVEEGPRGPLVVLTDGVVSLDGTYGSEVWSYRRPYDPHFEVWVDGDHVIVSRVPALGTQGPLLDVLDLEAGEQVWERTWTRSEDDRFHVSSGGPAGADPVLLVRFEGRAEEGMVLDRRSGPRADAVNAPAEFKDHEDGGTPVAGEQQPGPM